MSDVALCNWCAGLIDDGGDRYDLVARDSRTGDEVTLVACSEEHLRELDRHHF